MRTTLFSTLLALANIASAELPKCNGDSCFNAINAAGKGLEASAFCSGFLRKSTTVSSVTTLFATATKTETLPDAVQTVDVTVTVTDYSTQTYDASQTTIQTVLGTATESVIYTVTETVSQPVTESISHPTYETANAVVTETATDTVTVTENYDVTATEYVTDVPSTTVHTVEATTTEHATTTAVSSHYLQRRQATRAYSDHVSSKCPAVTNRGVLVGGQARLSSACSCIVAAPTSTSTIYNTVYATSTTNYQTNGPLATITTTVVGTASTLDIVAVTRTTTYTDVFSSVHTGVVTDYTTYVATDFHTTTETHLHTFTLTETSTASETSTELSSTTNTRTVDTSVITLPATTTFQETYTTVAATVTLTVGAEEPTIVRVYCGKRTRGSPSPALDAHIVRTDEGVYTARECHKRCDDVTACQGASHLSSAKKCVLYDVTLTGDNFEYQGATTHWGWSKACPKRVNRGPADETA